MNLRDEFNHKIEVMDEATQGLKNQLGKIPPLWSKEYEKAFGWVNNSRPDWSENQWRDYAIAYADMITKRKTDAI